jgi:hypothetical protein
MFVSLCWLFSWRKTLDRFERPKEDEKANQSSFDNSASIRNWQTETTLVNIRTFYQRSDVFQRVRKEADVGGLHVMTRLKGLTKIKRTTAGPPRQANFGAPRLHFILHSSSFLLLTSYGVIRNE